MKRMGIARAVMLLSLGVNVGIAAAWAQKWMQHRPTETDSRVETRGSPEPAEPDAKMPYGMVRYDAGRVTLDDTDFVAITTEVALPALLAALGNGDGGTLPDDGILRDKNGRVVSALFAVRGSVLNQLLCTGPKGTGASAGVRHLMPSFAPVGG